MTRTFLLVPLVFALRGPAQSLPATLAGRVAAITDAPRFQGASWGLLVVDRKTGAVLIERNADQRFAPASVTKLYSCAAALATLGADHRVETGVWAVGERRDDRLDGVLALRAAGDPNLGGRAGEHGRLLFRDGDHTYAGFNDEAALVEADPLAGLDALARGVAAAGLRHVRDVVVDERLWDLAEGTGSGPARLSPMVVNDNVVDFLVHPGAQAGDLARVDMRPRCEVFQVDARVNTVALGQGTEVTAQIVAPGRVALRGRIEAGRKPLLKIVEVEDPGAFARLLFVERLRVHGVGVARSPLAPQDLARLPDPGRYVQDKPLATLRSAPLAEELRVVLKVSHNLHAGMLPLRLAAHHGQRTLADGLRREGEALKALGLDLSTISFGSAAGGSVADLVTPRATVALLRSMAARPDFAVYHGALPVLGVDGTLARAVSAESPARGIVHAKTGTLTATNGLDGSVLLRSKALAGYATDTQGRELVFALFVNQTRLARPADVARVGETLGSICEVLCTPGS